MTKNNQKIKIIKDKKGNELIMLRVDKTVKGMMEEEPSSRLDAGYWHTNYTELEEYLKQTFDYKSIEELKDFLTLGHVGKMQYRQDGKVYVIGVKDILRTGFDPYTCRRIERNGPIDLPHRRVKTGDLLFIRSGVGSIGRTIVVTNLHGLDLSISGDVYLFRSSKINLFYLAAFLNNDYGYKQIERIGGGVSGQIHMNFPEFGRILVPVFQKEIQSHVEQAYLKMSKFHDKAVEAKKRGDEKGYKENLETAEKILRDLIAKTEAVIRGERKDVL